MLCVPADTPHALRYLLFGTSYKFPVRAHRGAGRHRATALPSDGIPGAAALQPWFLFNETQAWSYLAATAGTRLYDTFGTWRKNGRAAAKTRNGRARQSASPRSRRFATRTMNASTKPADRRAGLMHKAERVFRTAQSRNGAQSRQHGATGSACGSRPCDQRPG